jgi:molybdopterin-guanine dinucleotide biosynthesis protein B
MKLFGLVGWSGSGKTTLMVALVAELIGRGLTVSTIKHTHESVDLDRPGKDTHRHRLAGATEVVLASSSRWTLMHELRGAPEPRFDALLPRMSPVDLVLVEGFKLLDHDKLEVHRPSLGKPLLCVRDPHVVAVASDAPLPGLDRPVLRLDDVAGIAGFVIDHCRLDRR